MSQENQPTQQDPGQGITNTVGDQAATMNGVGSVNQLQGQQSTGNSQVDLNTGKVIAPESQTQSPQAIQNNKSLGATNLQIQPNIMAPLSDNQQEQQQELPTTTNEQTSNVQQLDQSQVPVQQPVTQSNITQQQNVQVQSQLTNSAPQPNQGLTGQLMQAQGLGENSQNTNQIVDGKVLGENNQVQLNPEVKEALANVSQGIPRYIPYQDKIKPNHGQGLGPTGAQIPQQISNLLIDSVKTGDIEKFMQEYRKHGVEVRDVISDMLKFKQNLVFAAIQIPSEDQAIEMIKQLCKLGVDTAQMDNLKQSPLYYTCRDGKIKLCQFLVEQGININSIDIYGQNAIYYAVNLGHIDVVKLLKAYGSDHDYKDENGQTPIYYAIKSSREEVLKLLLSYGCRLDITDNRGNTPMMIANRNKSANLKELLVYHGAQQPPDLKNRQPKGPVLEKARPPQQIASQPKSRVNEKLIPKEFVLQIFDGEQYRPITQYEFEKFSQSHPELSKFFTDEAEIEKLHCPQVDESVPIYHHWEKVASRMMSQLMRKHEAWIFLEPVDAHKLGIPDYFRIIQKPMDLGTCKENLRKHEYKSMQQFIDDVQLVFANCLTYNGENSQVGQMCSKVKEEYWLAYEQLNVEFYLCENIFK